MPRPKPQWKYENNLVILKPPSDTLIQEIKYILRKVNIKEEQIRDSIFSSFALYQGLSKHMADVPTCGEQAAAAKSIIKDIDSLLSKLDKDMGGLAGIYTYRFLPSTCERHEKRHISGLLNELEILRKCCGEALEPHAINMQKTASEKLQLSPKLLFIHDIAYFFREVINVPTSIYLPDEHDGMSMYAEVLSLCFQEIDGHVPRNLKSLMSQEKKLSKEECSQ